MELVLKEKDISEVGDILKKLDLKSSGEWREWLSRHHDQASEVWLVFYKKESRQPTIPYEQAVEEALCYGWIDSIIKKLDDIRYARKFTPRNENSVWSPSNKKRVAKLIKEGRMTEIGRAKIEAAKKSGWWDKDERPEIQFDMPAEFELALSKNRKAKLNFEKLARGYQKHYIIWIAMAKREETRQKRIQESLALLEKGEKLGLK